MNHPDVHLALYCVYWLQYCINFLLYAARNGAKKLTPVAKIKLILPSFANCPT